MSRDALVVGINQYYSLKPLNTPAADAEAIAQYLETYGNFQVVHRLPLIIQDDQFTVDAEVEPEKLVTAAKLEKALSQLFNPQGTHIPETALFFFAGHGHRKNRGGILEGYLATSETNPNRRDWGVSLKWLRELLQKSPIKQQVVWLDCCYSGELLNFEDADPGDRGAGYGRCFIAASREYEVAYESASSQHGVLTEILLQKLGADRMVDNYALTDFIQQNLKQSVQQPLTHNSGSRILLTQQPIEPETAKLSGECPYKGLRFFEEADAKYFYGRDDLTDELIEKVRLGNFLAVLGVSGSGKSSVVRAGLLHQLKLGKKLGESRQWRICEPFTPNEKEQSPFDNLARVLVAADLPDATWLKEFDSVKYLLQKGAAGFKQWLDKIEAPRVVLVIDQFEEFFTRCDFSERQQFFECVLGCLPPPEAVSQFCLVITMRADFLGKCAEQDYAGLTRYIDAHQVTVTPMSETELEAAISEPAKQVGLDIEAELITAMLKEVEGPASLPLLEYTLTELWQHRQLNCLTVAEYIRLGGVQGTLQKSADRAYAALTAVEQSVTQWIFFALTQLGEGTEDTRKQVLKTDLVTAQHSAGLIDQVLDKLATARLVVVDALGSRGDKQPLVTVIDVAHEALIRHWGKLRKWLDENREFKRWKDGLNREMQIWQKVGRKKEELLRGVKLLEAEKLLRGVKLLEANEQANQQHGMLNEEELTFITASVQEKQRLSWSKRIVSFGLVLLFIVSVVTGIFGWWQWGIAKQRSEIAELRYKGVLEERVEQPQKALDYYQQALKIARNISDNKAQVNNLSDCGTMYMILNKAEQALEYFKQSLKIREQLGDSKGVRFEKNNIVSAYGKMGEIEKALDFYQQAIGLQEKRVGIITHWNCSSDAFELFRGTRKIPLSLYMTLYYADQLKVIKENCYISVFEDKKITLVNKVNSPYIIIEKPSPSGLSAISKWFASLWERQAQDRTAAVVR